jgi:hypothetical protein
VEHPEFHPFGNLATLCVQSTTGPMALRPRLTTGLPLSRIKRVKKVIVEYGNDWGFARRLHPQTS